MWRLPKLDCKSLSKKWYCETNDKRNPPYTLTQDEQCLSCYKTILFFFSFLLTFCLLCMLSGLFVVCFKPCLWRQITLFSSIVTLDIDLNEAKRWHHLIPGECDTLKQKACYDACREGEDNDFCINERSCVENDNTPRPVNYCCCLVPIYTGNIVSLSVFQEC